MIKLRTLAAWAMLFATASITGSPARGAAAPSGAAAAPQDVAAKPSADEMLKEFNAMRPPPLDASKRNDPQYVRAYIAKLNEARRKPADGALSPDRQELP